MKDEAGAARRWWSTFIGLPPNHPAVAALARASNPMKLSPGEALVGEGDEDRTVFLVVSGALRAVRHTRNGHEVWLADIAAGEITGDMAALMGVRRTSSVLAKAPTTLFAVPPDAFLAIAQAHADFAVALARMLATRLHATSTHLAGLVALPVSTRLHGELAALGEQTSDPEVFALAAPTVTGLSHRIHATREATSRALKDLERRGFLKRSRSSWRIVVPDENYP